jgi:hypothetical protein
MVAVNSQFLGYPWSSSREVKRPEIGTMIGFGLSVLMA